MKVYILMYDYYEDSYIKGVYTEEGKNRKENEFLELARKHNQEQIEYWEIEILELKERRKPYIQRVDELSALLKKQNSLELKQLKKEVLKEVNWYTREIHKRESTIAKYSKSDKEIIAEYMCNNDLIWIEKELIS